MNLEDAKEIEESLAEFLREVAKGLDAKGYDLINFIGIFVKTTDDQAVIYSSIGKMNETEKRRIEPEVLDRIKNMLGVMAAKGLCMKPAKAIKPNRQPELPIVPKVEKVAPTLVYPDKTCANCDIGNHERCSGHCDCCIPS